MSGIDWNNANDMVTTCPHGRPWGCCDSCELAKVRAERDEARAEVEQLKATLAEVDEMVARSVDLSDGLGITVSDVARAAFERHRARLKREEP